MSAGMARILFILYSLVIGTIFSTVGFAYSPLAILYAFGTALTIFVVMAIYGFISKEDLKDIGNRDDNIQIFSIICVIVLKIYRPILQNIQ